ncbi:DUF2163 domain-containing protein [Acuticoccus sp. MNP-M23]|uniref:DUF2163 domain-containing protein n=1 Tax=Acuticoccus sp. MNP-M23 TaxID=3072793 RepID=UPI002816040B|nr:DUF2163 domain-containing protein [Acuticoccus sp. MNP-M23]WMS41701.1 DUF2163 domain-containing protein [Acuticoccus sp. MNP-M23]
MRTLDPGLAAHLASGVTSTCRCWRLTRTDGVSFGFTDHDRALTFEGVVFSAMDGLEASGDVTKAGLGVGGLEISGALSAASLDAGDLQDGRFDGATVTLWLVNWADVSERTVVRTGTLGEVTRADGAFGAEVRGPMQALETVRGRVIATGCDADLGDARCGVDLGALEENATVHSADGAGVRVTGISNRGAGYFAGGLAVVTSGSATGAKRLVVGHTVDALGRVITLRETLPGLAAGDVLTLTPGCDKRFDTCRAKFQNGLNFQGFPHLPGNDRAFSYPRSGS